MNDRACLLLAACCVAFEAGADDKPFDPSLYSQVPTQCDRLISHGDDPYHVAPGVEREDADLPAAIAACQAAVAADPKNPRLNYQLGRALGYSGRGREAIPYRKAATEANYPQSLFVVGFMTLFGINEQPKDVCTAGELLRRSAIQGRLAGQFGFPHYTLEGRFADCQVKQDTKELLGFVEAGRKQAAGDYYQGLLADRLQEDLESRLTR